MSDERHDTRDHATANAGADVVYETYSVETTVRLTGVGPARLIRYERARLVAPLRAGPQRYYSQADLKRIRKARRLERDLGVNLAGIEIILRLTEQLDAARRQLADDGARP